MDLKKVIIELRARKEQIDQAIVALERLTLARKGRGRPQKGVPESGERVVVQKSPSL
jgi:hypothetical protein